jgi:hypothetical protein
LPKETGYYFVKFKQKGDSKIYADTFASHYFGEGDNKDAIWLDCIEWYLQPCTDKRDEPKMTKAEIIEVLKKRLDKYIIHGQEVIDSEYELIASDLQESGEKTADVNKFCDRLDEIFEQGDPTKAQIIDAFNKFSAQSVPEISDEEILIESRKQFIEDYADIFVSGAGWYKSELAKRMNNEVTMHDLKNDDDIAKDERK